MKHKVARGILIFFLGFLVLMICLMLSGCNEKIFQPTHNFQYGIIKLPNGEIVEGKIEHWAKFQYSYDVIIKINGVNYFVNTTNCVMEEK